MKKIIVISLMTLIFVGIFFTSIKKSTQELTLANIEALATGETGDVIPCWSAFEPEPGYMTTSCLDCTSLSGYKPAGYVKECVKK